MEYLDKLYQFILFIIKTIKELVAGVKGEEIATEPTIVDKTN